uniref:BPTI/Kunitz inhibitor domain-containing protein n=1 Tax=Sinocyclocheilus anshuiensis TaxID=1608454 RepID=A0A671R8M9_9TELE
MVCLLGSDNIWLRYNYLKIWNLRTLDPGPCREYVVKWYFDPKANSCAQFWFGGCQGNKNQFDSQEGCRKSCVKM